MVPSPDGVRWIALFNLLDLLQKLHIRAAITGHNDILMIYGERHRSRAV